MGTSVRKRHKRVILHIKTVYGKLAQDLEIGPDDLRYVLRRLHSEGLPFVTKTLPLFAKFAIRCCDKQRILPRSFLTNFEWKGCAPRFLRGLLLKAINGNPCALRSIRQFCEYFYKASFGFTSQQLLISEKKYVSSDYELSQVGKLDDIGTRAFWNGMRVTLHTLFPRSSSATPQDVLATNRPHDGPGSFADSGRIERNLDLPVGVFKLLPASVVGLYPDGASSFAGFFKAYPGCRDISRSAIPSLHGSQVLGSLERRESALHAGLRRVLMDTRVVVDRSLSSGARVSELRFVPKDSRGPRVISKEPYLIMKAQMSFMGFFGDLFCSESNGRINFLDQSINQELARKSSIDRSFATIDLKDASDRVTLPLVGFLFQHTSALRYFASRFRSTHVKLPTLGVHRLRKFANMGSGMCFPILALVVYLAAVTAISRSSGKSINTISRDVYVYGDDLIVPSHYLAYAREGLRLAGLLVNEDKSFASGYFRESCGADFYHGVDVGITRFKMSGESFGPVADYRNGFLPLQSDRGILQLERHVREVVDFGLLNLARYLYRSLNKVIPLPSVSRESSVLGIYDPDGALRLPTDKYSGFYYPVPITSSSGLLCPYKLLSKSLKGTSDRDTDPYLIPLRYEIRLKKKQELEHALCHPCGIPGDPRQLFDDIKSIARS